MFKNETDMLAEHEESKARAEAARLEAQVIAQREQQAKWDAQREESRKREVALRVPHLLRVAAHLAHRDAQVDVEKGHLTVDGIHAQISFSSTSRSRAMEIGYGQYRTRLPIKRDGTYSYKKAADAVEGHTRRELQRTEWSRVQKRNEPIAARVLETCGLEKYSSFGVRPSASPELPVHVEYKLSGAMTAEKAVALVAALRSCGLKI